MAFVLVHSPLVGPMTWARVAAVLRAAGEAVAVPQLSSPPGLATPYWLRHVEQIREAVHDGDITGPVMLAGHSGGGALLPIAAARLGVPVTALLYVDALIPEDGKSRLDLFESPEIAREFRVAAVDGLMPVWTAHDLRDTIPDDTLRAAFTAELRPMPLAVYDEPIPVPEAATSLRSGYIRFGANPAYDMFAARARAAGWPVAMLPGRHFHMLVDPATVAGAMRAMTEALAG